MEKSWVKYEEKSKTYGRFIAEPLARGYGSTLGNSLRRILLSSLGGAAVVSVIIDGVDHEFSTLSGVQEDVLDIILNIKGLVLKSYSDTQKEISIVAKGEGVVTAKDIQHDDEIEIINSDHHIATLNKNGKLNIKMEVVNGNGYEEADIAKNKKAAIGTIPIDASFTPIVKVNHTVEPTRVGKSIDFDKLVLDVWTDGSITPEDAMKQGADILKKQLDLFINLNQKPVDDEVEGDESAAESNKGLSLTIDDLELSARSSNCLKKAGIKNVGELVETPMEKLMTIKNFGKKSSDEINEKLSQYGLALKGDISDLLEEEEEEGADEA